MPEIINYGTMLRSVPSGWDPVTAPLLVGPPDGQVATNSTLSTTAAISAYLRAKGVGQGFDLLRSDMQINRVLIGIRLSASSTTNANCDYKCSPGDQQSATFGIASGAGTTTIERDLDYLQFPPSVLQDPALSVFFNKSSVSTQIRIDAVWLRAVYDIGLGITSFATSVSMIGTGWSTLGNAIGPANNTYAGAGSITNPPTTLVATMDGFADLPADAVLQKVLVGFRGRQNQAAQFDVVNLPESMTPTRNYGPLYPTNQSTEINANNEFEVPLSEVTVEQLKRPTWRVTFNKVGSGNAYIDDVWTRVVYTLPSVMKRWDGAAWVPAITKRWDGTQWVHARSRRWNGVGWV